ncbi:MAG: GWxTD domain-containing protein [Calditrichia bacterium]
MKTRSVIVVLATLLYGSTLFAQLQQRSRDVVGLPVFVAKIASTLMPTTGEPMARIYMQIQNDQLTFLKNEDVFDAELQLEVYFRNESEEFVFNRTITRKVIARDYNATNSKKHINTFYTDIAVQPGTYAVTLTVTDLNSAKQFTRKINYDMPPLVANDADNARLVISDILFFSEHKTDSSGRITAFSPTLSNSFSSNSKTLYAYFSTWSSNSDEAKVHYVVRDQQNLPVLQNSYQLDSSNYQEHFIKLNRYSLGENQYQMELEVKSGTTSLIASAPLRFFWRFVPDNREDLNLAIEQLRYIANTDSIKKYRKAPYEDKKNFFERFWDSQDPNPDTEVNELLREYYRRVNYSTERFSATSQAGWLTDRGRIFIKFGEPDDVERHPFAQDSYPYQIWRYYSLRKTFLFIDRTGFGDYNLHPSYFQVEYEN